MGRRAKAQRLHCFDQHERANFDPFSSLGPGQAIRLLARWDFTGDL